MTRRPPPAKATARFATTSPVPAPLWDPTTRRLRGGPVPPENSISAASRRYEAAADTGDRAEESGVRELGQVTLAPHRVPQVLDQEDEREDAEEPGCRRQGDDEGALRSDPGARLGRVDHGERPLGSGGAARGELGEVVAEAVRDLRGELGVAVMDANREQAGDVVGGGVRRRLELVRRQRQAE